MLSGASPPNQTGPCPGVMWRLQNAICGSRGPLETQELTKVVWVSAFLLVSILGSLRVVNLYSQSPLSSVIGKNGWPQFH